MPKELFDRPQSGHRASPRGEELSSPGPSAVEEIWSSWRYEKGAPPSDGNKKTAEPLPRPRALQQNPVATPAELVHQLKRQGEYRQALEVALSEIEREEKDGGHRVADRQSVPWYYWEAATLYRGLKRYNDEIALIRRFANNHDIHFRAFSKRYRSSRAATHTWATNFLERIDAARAAAAASEDEGN
jgi:hypothetical protein